jgi:hypothetical protein
MTQEIDREADEDEGGRKLLDVCLELHMHNSGGGDPWCFDRERYVHVLRTAIANWREGSASSKGFDDAVKNLIVKTLEEDDGRRPAKENEQ